MPPSSPIAAPAIDSLVNYLEHDAVPTIVMDPDYTILAGNAAYRRQFGVKARPFLGQKCYRVSHGYDAPCDQSGEHCPMKHARDTRAPDRVLHVHHTPRGPEHVDVELRPILAADGTLAAYVERLTTLRHASPQASRARLIGHSVAFNKALSAVQRVAPSRLPVLLQGESGTGKELFARAVHETSDRAQGPFVIVDCSGLTETLFESELFGYEKGAFTGAHARKAGLVETAEGGTLFLDEIGDVPLALQVKLLRLLESGTFRRVGAVQMQRADVRLVAATHLPLEAMMQAGRFRKDLYFRLSAFPIHLPPLRERVEDLPVLVQTLLQQESAPNAWRIDAAAMARLARYAWPGNVRELRNVIERAKLLADGGEVREEHLPDALLAATRAGAASAAGAVAAAPRASGPSDAELQRLAADRGLSRKALAQQLGLSERTLYRRLKALGVAPPAD